MTTTRTSLPAFSAISDEEIADWLRIDYDTDVAAVMMLISSATEIVESITGLTIRQASYQIDTVAQCGYVPITLTPIQTITSVSAPDDTGALQPVNGWTFANGCLSLPTGFLGAVTIVLIAGFPSPAAIPDSLRHAIAVVVAAGYDNRSEIDDQTMTTVMRLVNGQRVYLS